MNGEVKRTANILLWGCMFLALRVSVCAPTNAKDGNSTIVPLNKTGTLTTSNSVNTYIHLAIIPTSSIDTLNDTSEFGNITSSTTDINNEQGSQESRLNLAVIPVVGVFIFMTVLCLKCCSWFRDYTRGNVKESGGIYDIVQQGDDDFDPIEMKSDSASTIYYDTVSSFCSFLRRNDYETSVTSYKALKLNQLNQIYNPSNKAIRDFRKKMIEHDTAYREFINMDCVAMTDSSSDQKSNTERSAPKQGHNEVNSPLSNSPKRRRTRTPSGSSDVSADTEQSLLSDTDRDTPKRQRFKVSFVTEDNEIARNNKQQKDKNVIKSIITRTKCVNATTATITDAYRPRAFSLMTAKGTSDLSQSQCSNASRMSSKIVCKADVERDLIGNKTARKNDSATQNDNPFSDNTAKIYYCTTGDKKVFLARRVSYKPTHMLSENSEVQNESDITKFPQTRDYGTQTDKSYRLAMRKGRKRYSSEVCDDNIIPPTISELAEMCSCKIGNCKDTTSVDTDCTCDNLLDDLSCDDVFVTTDPVVDRCLEVRTVCDKTPAVNETLEQYSDNRLTNHEWDEPVQNENIVETMFEVNNETADIEKQPNAMNSDIKCNLLTPNTENSNKLSLSSNNILRRDISNDNSLLQKYCSECNNFNKSVPNLCYTYQKLSSYSDNESLVDSNRKATNTCKTCSTVSEAQLIRNSRNKLLDRGFDNPLQARALNPLRRDSSIVSDDLSISGSSLSSSGYVEISSDVSSS